jgi:hypothetical protein
MDFLRIKNRAKNRNAETEGNRERDPISEGLPPLLRHGGQGPEGKPSTHLGGGQGRRRMRGALSPSLLVAPERRRGNHRVTAIYSDNPVIFTNTSITFPHLSTAVHSPATRCTLYLNMVLYASHYYPMMCCHPMMLE